MIKEMDAIPQSIIQKLQELTNYEYLQEITILKKELDKDECEYYDEENCPLCNCIECNEYENWKYEKMEYNNLPMWGWLWIADNLIHETDIKKLSEIGFRIYESEDFNYLIGIDGAGFSFYDHYWLPMYNALNLQWHDEPYKYEELHEENDGYEIEEDSIIAELNKL